MGHPHDALNLDPASSIHAALDVDQTLGHVR
jgi:hypothetical protein